MASGCACLLETAHRPIHPLFSIDEWQINQCGECGLIMTGAAFEDLYQTPDYYTLESRDVDHLYREWGFRWRWVLSRLQAHGGAGALLDAGAGNGLFVKIAAEEYGWQARGIELSQPAVEFARSVLGVKLERIELASMADEFDAATCFNVLEHVQKPVEFLSEIASRLRVGGLVAISTPSPSSIQARVKGLKRWGMICPPHHLNIFTRKSLELAARKAGLEPLEYQTISTYIRALRRIEGDRATLKRAAFNMLRISGLGADHLLIARRVGI